MVTTDGKEFTASDEFGAKEEVMVGLKQRPNTATDSAPGPMTEVTTPTPRERCKAVGSHCRFCPRATGLFRLGTTSFPARSHRRRDGYGKRQQFRAAA